MLPIFLLTLYTYKFLKENVIKLKIWSQKAIINNRMIPDDK